MEGIESQDTAGCTACSGCQTTGQRPPHESPGPALTGWRLALAAAGSFLMPLILAILAAILAGGGTNRRVLATGIGLGVGVLLAVVGARLLARRSRTQHEG
jgi:hypothetical protein